MGKRRPTKTRWAVIKLDFEIGESLRELSARHGVSKSAIGKRAKVQGWCQNLGRKTDSKCPLPRPTPADAADTPLAYMLAVMKDPNADPDRRDAMARAAAPYVHAKPASGKKAWEQQAAEEAGTNPDSEWGNDLLVPRAPRANH